jgi:micrococcal nuclease
MEVKKVKMWSILILILGMLIGACTPAPPVSPIVKIPSRTLTFAPLIVSVVPTAISQPSATATTLPTATQTPTLVPLQVSAKQTVNVRQGYGTQFAIVGKLQPNTSVVVLAKSNDGQWLQIPIPDAANPGWVSVSVVTVIGSIDSLQAIVLSPTATRTIALTTKSATPKTTSRVTAQVSRVIDGDTIEVTMDSKPYTVRYIGIDTPETVAPNTPVQWMGPEASAANKSLVEGKSVFLEKDVSETDKYGRLLRYVYVGDLFVNAELVKRGYAQVSTYPPDVKYQTLFSQAQQEARTAKRGLWGATSTPIPQSTVAPARSGNCDLAYPDVCIAPPPPDLDCKQIPYKRFRVLSPDPHGFDGDHDGIGCEN